MIHLDSCQENISIQSQEIAIMGDVRAEHSQLQIEVVIYIPFYLNNPDLAFRADQ
jgi:hypothetical protein